MTKVPLSSLRHIAVLVLPSQLAAIEAHPDWLAKPIHLRRAADGRLWLRDGAHRLTAARSRGAKTIQALIDPDVVKHGAEAVTEV